MMDSGVAGSRPRPGRVGGVRVGYVLTVRARGRYRHTKRGSRRGELNEFERE